MSSCEKSNKRLTPYSPIRLSKSLKTSESKEEEEDKIQVDEDSVLETDRISDDQDREQQSLSSPENHSGLSDSSLGDMHFSTPHPQLIPPSALFHHLQNPADTGPSSPLPHHHMTPSSTSHRLQQAAAVANRLRHNLHHHHHASSSNLQHLLATSFLQQQSELMHQDIINKHLISNTTSSTSSSDSITSSSKSSNKSTSIKRESDEDEDDKPEGTEDGEKDYNCNRMDTNDAREAKADEENESCDVKKEEVTADSRITTSFSVLDILDPHKFTGRQSADLPDSDPERQDDKDDSTFISGELKLCVDAQTNFIWPFCETVLH